MGDRASYTLIHGAIHLAPILCRCRCRCRPLSMARGGRGLPVGSATGQLIYPATVGDAL